MHTVSIHIVTYNSAATINACLESVRAQKGVDYCLLVIDNASSDNTVELLHLANIEPIINSHNIGYAAAHNIAIDQTKSRYVLTLNPDVRLQPDFLRTMV